MEYDGFNDCNATCIWDGLYCTKLVIFLLVYNIGGMFPGHGVRTCMEERKVHFIGARGLHQETLCREILHEWFVPVSSHN
jgi:hypothetical protein